MILVNTETLTAMQDDLLYTRIDILQYPDILTQFRS